MPNYIKYHSGNFQNFLIKIIGAVIKSVDLL